MQKRSKRQQRWARFYKKQQPEWHVWGGMKRRCYYPKHVSYPFYGARGIKVCDRWLEHYTGFKNFLEDLGPRPSKLYSLDRIDPDGNYCKENCRWLLGRKNYASSRGCFKPKEEVPF